MAPVKLEDIGANWDKFGELDPMWAILADPAKRGGKWSEEEFFATGRTEIEAVLDWVAKTGLRVERRRALDFGCGIGRLTQALAEHFDQVDGVDIAPSMVDRARLLNRHGERCRFHVNRASDLRLFPDGAFDFVYSVIVLQHVPPAISSGYLREFFRVLAPGGVSVFQLPSQMIESAERPAGDHQTFQFNDMGTAAPLRMEMFGLPRTEVERIVHDGDGRVHEARPDGWAGPMWESYFYLVSK